MNTPIKDLNTAAELDTTPEVWFKNTSKDIGNILIWPASDLLYSKNPVKSADDVSEMLDEVRENLEEKHFNKKNIKLVNNVLMETCDNLVRYTPDEYKDESEIKIGKWKEWKYLFINATNYFDNGSTDQNNFTKNIKQLNSLSADELREKEKSMTDENKDLHEKWWAGKWFVNIIKRIKRFAEKNGIPNIPNIISTQINKMDKSKFKFNLNIKIPINPPMPDTWMAA